jgi:hypothetical protein
MRKTLLNGIKKVICCFIFTSFWMSAMGQNQNSGSGSQSDFWQKVQFGGGLGLSIGSGYTEIGIAPSAIYNVNETLAVGAGFQVSYVDSQGFYSSFIYGLNAILLVNPIPQIQLSIGLSESRVNYDYNEFGYESYSDNYWSTGLILGAGYRTGNVTIGVGYNVLQNDPYQSDSFVPFVRAYF